MNDFDSNATTVPVARLRHVSKTYLAGAVRVRALRDVSLRLASHRFTMIVGPSGSGKTTLLNLLGCLDAPDEGTVEFRRQEMGRLRDNAVWEFRARNAGFVFQNFNLIPVLSAYENVEYPLFLTGMPTADRVGRRRRCWPPSLARWSRGPA